MPTKPQSLWNKGFIALLVTQFTVAFNDNAFRWLLVPIGKAYTDGDFVRTLGGFFLLVPFLLWTSVAGYVTDRYSRRNVIIWCKLIEMLLLAAAIGAIMLGPAVSGPPAPGTYSMPGHLVALLVILFLLGSQSTFFSPSKYGTIPDLVPEEKLSAANGLVSMLTMVACVSGQVTGGFLFFWTTRLGQLPGDLTVLGNVGTPGGHQIWITAVCLVGIAFVGLVSSFFIPKMKPVDTSAKFPRNPFLQTGKDIAALFSYRKLFWIAVASAFFWGLAALAQNNIDKFATEYLMVQQQYVTILVAILSIGIGIGAVVCGFLSGKRIELGLVPIGAFGMGFFILLLGFSPIPVITGGNVCSLFGGDTGPAVGDPTAFPYLFALTMMFIIGIWAGMYDIPLSAYIQHNSPPEQRGRMIAAYNFLSFSTMLVFIVLGLGLAKLFAIVNLYDPSLLIWIVTGLGTILVGGVLMYYWSGHFFVVTLTWLFKLLYRPKVIGLENLPEEGQSGGAILVSNHVSLLDGPLLYCVCPRNIQYLAFAKMVPRILEGCVTISNLIKILPGNPKNIITALRQARETLCQGGLVGIFPEGGITRNGQMRHFEPGFMNILKGAKNPDGSPVPVIPVYIGGLHESMFSYKYGDKEHDGRNIKWWRPRKLPNDVIISFGKPIYGVQYPMEVQRAVQELGVNSYEKYNTKPLAVPGRCLIRTCRKRAFKRMYADSTGLNLSGFKFLTAVLALRKLLNEHVLENRENEPHVGVLTPMTVGGCLLNAALCLDRRVPVDLNFTFGAEGINYCIKQAGIKHVLTSKKVMQRFPDWKLDAEIIYTEDLLPKVTGFQKIAILLRVVFWPNWLHDMVLGLRKKGIEEELSTLIYTSGSTGKPKGVMLTNKNLVEVGRSFVGAMKLNEKDTVLGFLPFFHAFGFMGNYWLPIFCGGSGVFHFSPLEPKTVGEMARQFPITFLASTPTFLRNFLRRCPKEDFETVHTVMCGAEKLPVELMDAWEEKYGHRPGEGFGATELSPLPTTNVPDCRATDDFHLYRKDGSIGRAVQNVAVKVIDLDTGKDLPPNEIGMIVVKGPIVMKGYYKQPELTAEVVKDGWYTTGDVGKIDEEGFVWITGRQTRISKIGGEMVPHVLIEDEILKIVAKANAAGAPETEDGDKRVGPPIAVTALPHETKGERIVVLYRDLPLEPKEIVDAMIAANVPKIWIPHLDGFLPVDDIPVLGTGKLDLAALKTKAAEAQK